jgi:hypothetical protein
MAKFTELEIGQEWAVIAPAAKDGFWRPYKATIVELKQYIQIGSTYNKKYRAKDDISYSVRGPSYVKVTCAENKFGEEVTKFVLLSHLSQKWADYEIEREESKRYQEKIAEERKRAEIYRNTVVAPKRELLAKTLSQSGVYFSTLDLTQFNDKQLDVMLNIFATVNQ